VISRLRGTLVSRDGDRVEVATAGGVTYELNVPLTVAENLPRVGDEVELRTAHVIRQDFQGLYGFLNDGERALFRRLLAASGVGPALALSMLSTFPAPRLARALVERDLAALVQISGVGKKTAERIAVDLSDRLKDLTLSPAPGDGAPPERAHAAVRALVALGMDFHEADQRVRAALEEGDSTGTDELIRRALADQ
jgi:holliday junction DNA helicase RuvA